MGALGFASSQLTLHKSESGHPIPSYGAAHAEFDAIARGIQDAGGGLIQFVPDLVAGDYEPVLQTVFDVAADVGLPVTFTLAIGNAGDPFFLDALTMVEKANINGGDISAQIFPRPIGLVLGLELSGNPFVMYPSYREIAGLPLAERVAEMRKPEVPGITTRLPAVGAERQPLHAAARLDARAGAQAIIEAGLGRKHERYVPRPYALAAASRVLAPGSCGASRAAGPPPPGHAHRRRTRDHCRARA